jgi:beta-glucanase (GH16 family)
MKLLVMTLLVVSCVGTSFCDEAGWKKLWGDEFDSLDKQTWTKAVHGPGGSDTRDASASASASYIQGGSLVLRSNGTWNGTTWTNLTSGAVESRGKKSFRANGIPTRVCISAKLPGAGGGGKGLGIWPALWLMPDTPACWPCAGEIDIVEMINGDGMCRGTYHWSRKNVSGDNQQAGGMKRMAPDWGDTFHEFAVEFDGKSSVKFALDGEVYETVTAKSRSAHRERAMFFDVPY